MPQYDIWKGYLYNFPARESTYITFDSQTGDMYMYEVFEVPYLIDYLELEDEIEQTNDYTDGDLVANEEAVSVQETEGLAAEP